MKGLPVLVESRIQKLSRISKPPVERRSPSVVFVQKRPLVKSFALLQTGRPGNTPGVKVRGPMPQIFVRSPTNIRNCRSLGDFTSFEQVQHICQRMGTILPHKVIIRQRDNVRDIFFLKCAYDLQNLVKDQLDELPVTCLDILKTMIEFHIFKERGVIEKRLYVSDVKTDIFLTHIEEMQQIYNVLAAVILKADHEKMVEWFTPGFLAKFVTLFTTPDPREQKSLQETLMRIATSFPELRDTIVSHILRQFDRVVNCIAPVFCVQPLLNVLTQLISMPGGGCADAIPEILRVSCGLFVHQLLYYFYDAIHAMMALITKHYHPATRYIFQYLLQHWPSTSATKQCLFLHHLSWQLRNGHDLEEALVQRYIRLLKHALYSCNFKVLVVIIGQLGEPSMIEALEKHEKGVSSMIVHRLQRFLRHWSKDVVESTKTTFGRLFVAIPEISDYYNPDAIPDGEDVETEESDPARDAAWEAIRRAALAVDV